jgi:hypothetical protein
MLVWMALAVPCTGLSSQVPDWVRAGSRLRVTTQASPERRVGTLLSYDADSITMRAGTQDAESVSVALSDIVVLELSRERGNRTVAGAAIGALALGALGAYWIASDPDVGDKGAGALVGFGLLGSVGAVLGGAIGSNIQTDVWVALPIAHQSRDYRRASALGVRLRVERRR